MKVLQSDSMSDNDFALILSILRRGGVIGFPTDTAYGLGVDPFNTSAVKRIFEIKGRTEAKPILLLVSSMNMAESIIEPNPLFHDIVRQFWPGPLTVIVRAAETVPEIITAGTKTVGIRWPAARFANALVDRCNHPLTATSANRSGLPAAITAEEVAAQLGNSVDALIDGGVLSTRVGSTLLDLTLDPPVLVREGPVSFQSLHEFLDGRIRRQVA